MTGSLFLILLTVFGSITTLIVEAIKKLLDEYKKKYSSNMIALITGNIVGILGTACTYIALCIPPTSTNIMAMVLMGVAVSVGSMVGYDKVKQIVEQTEKIGE